VTLLKKHFAQYPEMQHMNSLAHAALNKRTAARRSALLSAACAGALLIAAPAMAQQLEFNNGGAADTQASGLITDGSSLTVDGTLTATIGNILGGLNVAGSTTTNGLNNTGGILASGEVRANTLQSDGLATLNSASVTNGLTVGGNISGDGSINAVGNLTTTTGYITTNSGNVSTISGDIFSRDGNVRGATLTSTGLATLESGAVTNNLSVGSNTTTGTLTAGATTTGSLSAGGNITTSADLIAVGNVSTVGGDISTTSGNVSGATLTSTGLATLDSAQVHTTLNVDGATTLGQLTTTGQVVMNDTLTATGTVNAGSIVVTSGDITSNQASFITTNGNVTTTNGDIATTNGTVSSATLSTTGAATIGSALSVGGVGGGGSTAGSIVVKRAAGSDSVVIDGALGNISAFNRISAGALQSSNSASIGTSLSVGSMATIGTSLSVGTNATIGGTLSVGTNATIGGTLSVGTNATIGGTLDVTGETNTAGMTNRGLFNTFQGRAGVYANDFETPFAGIYAGNSDLRLTDTSATLGFGSNGMVATADSLTLRGGTASTTMTLNDSGASFANVSDGAPVTVTGIANGSSSFDAVNYGQLSSLESKMSAGIASIAAIANIPAPPTGKRFAIGGAVGGFNGETAFAIGGTANVTTEVVVKASVGFSDGQAAFGAGAAYAW
jgi:hypothetical protein